MSCRPVAMNFRLLDAYVGWDAGQSDVVNIEGLDDTAGLRLALLTRDAIDAGELLRYIPPARLARGCGSCEWFLITPAPPTPSRLLRRGVCTQGWEDAIDPCCDSSTIVNGVAVTARGHRIAVSDAGSNVVWIWSRGGEQLDLALPVHNPGALAFTSNGGLLVVSGDRLLQFSAVGEPQGEFRTAAPDASGVIERIAVSDDCIVWLVTALPDGMLHLWRAGRDDQEFMPASITDLAKSFPPTGIVAAGDAGFCFEQRFGGAAATHCWSWYGRCIDGDAIPHPRPPERQKQGQLLAGPIDSGIARCRWHRVRMDADVPAGTAVEISITTIESAGEIPHPGDWQTAPAGVLDFLVDRPAGQRMLLKLKLTSDGYATPVVRRIRLDFPRATSAEFLPPVYRESLEAEDFLERFLSLFDATIADLDRNIARAPALLDPDCPREEVLPWLGGLLDLAFDPAWDAARRRRILKALPQLYRQRGTRAGLLHAIALVFDVDASITELWSERQWAGLSDRSASLGVVRLFSRSRGRFRAGRSVIGVTPLKSFGNPDTDAVSAGAYRFRVMLPPGAATSPVAQRALRQLIESQKPAHTVANVRIAGGPWIVGHWSGVGVDSVLGHVPPPVIGQAGNVRLRRTSILWHARRGARPSNGGGGIVVGKMQGVGVSSVLQ